MDVVEFCKRMGYNPRPEEICILKKLSEQVGGKIDVEATKEKGMVILCVGEGHKAPALIFDEYITEELIKMISKDIDDHIVEEMKKAIFSSVEFLENSNNRFKRRHPNERFENTRYKRERNNSKNYHK